MDIPVFRARSYGIHDYIAWGRRRILNVAASGASTLGLNISPLYFYKN